MAWDVVKMEISPIRQLKNLTIEARHTLSLQESKKKRLKFEKSLFLPNNKKRKDVLKFFDKKSPPLNKIIKPPPTPNTGYFNSEILTHLPAEIPASYDSDLSSEGSDHSDGSLSMKRNRPVKKEVGNAELATSDNDEPTDDMMVFPSYVIYRTKGNKIKLVQDKAGQKTSSPTSTSEEEPQELVAYNPGESQEIEEPISIAENPEATTEPSEIENPSISRIDPEELNAQVAASTLIDLSQKSQPNEELTVSPSANVNTPPCLPSTSSNSMEFLMQSIASNESTAFSSDCLDKSNVDPPSVSLVQKTTDSSKSLQPTEAKLSCLMKASSPRPLCDVIINNEILPMPFPPNNSQLIQDTEIQSSTITTRSDEVLVTTSNTDDTQIQTVQNIPNTEYNLLRTCTQVSNNLEAPTEETVTVAAPSPLSEDLTSVNKMRDLPSLKRYFEAITQQRQIASEENTASTSLGIASTEEQRIRSEREATLMETLKAQCNMNGQAIPTADCPGPKNSSAQKAFPGVPNCEFHASHYASHHETANQGAATQQAETTPRTSSETPDLLARMENIPNSNRYFKPFYLQRPPVYGVETTPSTSKPANPSTEQQQQKPTPVATTQRRSRQTQKPSSSTQEKTKMSAQSCATKAAMEAYAKSMQYPFPPAYNNPISSPQQIFSHQVPTHAQAPEPKQMNHSSQQINKPYTRTSSTIENTPIEIPRPEMFPRPQAPAPAPAQAPAFHNNPYYNQSYPPPLLSSTNQHSFPPFPVVQQQPNMHSYNAPSHAPHPKQSPFPQPPIPKPNTYGYPPRHELGSPHPHPHPSYNYQPPFPIPQNSQYSSPNQTGPRPENNQGPYNSRNYAPPPPPPNIPNSEMMRYNSGHQCSYWCQHQHQHQHQHHQKSPPAEPPSHPQPPVDQSGSTVDPNKWLNDRLQQTLRPPDKIDKSTWVARPHQETVRPPSTSPMDMETWMRARTQQATKPSTTEMTTEQRLSQLEAVVNSFNEFVNNFEGFKKTLTNAVEAPSPPSPPAMALPPTSQPWQPQPMVSNSPAAVMGSSAMQQPAPDPRAAAWDEYYNLMNTRQMQGNTGCPRGSTAPENPPRVDPNSVPQYPVSQQMMSHQINAADSTTGGNPSASIDFRSFRSSQNCNQSYPHNTFEPWKNQYHYFK